MIRMFAKELRENLKWAAVIFGVISMVIYTLMRQRAPTFLFRLSEAPLVFFAPLAGLLMGIAQTVFETRPDNWAFVVHRPVSRPRIFAAKCAAGLLLLFAALGLPSLLAAAWAARPGHIRMPFQYRMMVPALAVVWSAGCFYFAGMVLTLRKARWLGTRLLPLGSAIICSFAVFLAPEFRQAMLFIIAGHCIGAMAAWGAFATAGAADRGFAPRFAFGTMVYAGALAIGAGLIGILGIFQTTTSSSWWRLDRDGKAVRVVTTVNRNSRTVVISDLSGRRLPEYDGVDPEDPAQSERFVRLQGALIDERMIPSFFRDGYRAPSTSVITLRAVTKPGARMPFTCLFDLERRIIDLYDSSSRILIGTVGPAGFSPSRAEPTERFGGPPLNRGRLGGHVLAFDSVVYWLELDHLRLRKLFDASADDPVISAIELSPETDPTVLIATRHRLHVMRPSGDRLFTAPFDAEMGRYYYMAAMLPSNHHLSLWRGLILPTKSSDSLVLEFASDGALVRTIQPPRYEATLRMARPRIVLVGFMYPLAGLPLYSDWVMDWLLQTLPQNWWVFHGCMFGSSLLCAGAAFLLGRRYGFGTGKTIAWSAASLLLGPASIVVLLGLHELPARETCAACGRLRLAGRRMCSRCASAMPPPRFDGREIFEPSGGVAALA